MKWTAAVLALVPVAKANCLGNLDRLVFRDPVDGDMKQVSAVGMQFAIQPYPNVDDWRVLGEFDFNCVATVDFNVTGKPNPPPVKLTMTSWVMGSYDNLRTMIGLEFTDPSTTLSSVATDPVNLWTLDHWPHTTSDDLAVGPRGLKPLQMKFGSSDTARDTRCRWSTPRGGLPVGDMHDGDKKSISVTARRSFSGFTTTMTVKPYHSSESWTAKTQLDANCEATLDLRVAGKPNPPPVPLTIKVWDMVSVSLDDNIPDKKVVLFEDPTQTIGEGILNLWVEGNVVPAQVV